MFFKPTLESAFFSAVSARIDYGDFMGKQKYFEPQDVIKAIHNRYVRGLPVNAAQVQYGPQKDRTLYNAGGRLWGTWTKALAVAGLSELQRERPNPDRYTSAENVLAAILRRRDAGLSPISSKTRQGPDCDNGLWFAAQRFFGSWYAAVEAAGATEWAKEAQRQRSSRRTQNSDYPDAAAVLDAIRRRRYANQGLKRRDLITGQHTDPALLRATVREFGSWPVALTATGLVPSTLRKSKRIFKYESEKAVAERIKELRAQGVPMSVSKLRMVDTTLYKSARRLFGSWEKALTCAGISYAEAVAPKPSRVARTSKRSGSGYLWSYPSPMDVIAAIRESSCRVEDWSEDLKQAARHHFGTTSNAIAAVQ